MYWGGTIKGATYGEPGDAPGDPSVLEAFEHHAGKKVTFINTGQEWASFDRGTMQEVIEAGALPLVTMGLPPGITLAEVAEGKQDAQIAAWARAAREWGYPFLFRPWWEVNGDWYRWGRSPDYVAAWRHFHDIVVREGATNVTWAWVVDAVWSDPASDPTPYYPGDEYVDWVGMDAYNWGRNPLQPDRWATPRQVVDPTLKVLEGIAPGKPVCICEQASTEIGGDKPSWIREMLSTYLPHHPSIKAYLWFNWDIAQGSGRWDWPIESSASSEQAFRDAIQSSTYLSRLPQLRKLEKVPIPPLSGPSEPLGPAPPSTLPGNGGWSGTLETSEAGGDAREPDASIGPDGVGTLVWDQFDGSEYVVRSRRVGPGGSSLGSVTTLSPSGRDAFRPQVSVGADGTATVAWVQYEGAASAIYERRIGPGGTPEPEGHRLSATGQSADQVQVGSRSDGGAVVVWERYGGSRTTEVQSSEISAAGMPAAVPVDLSDGSQNAVEPQVAVEPDGSAIVVWTRYDGADQVVQGRRVETTGTPDPTTFDLSESGEDAIEPSLAMGPDGSATVAWVRSDGSDELVQSSKLLPSGGPAGVVETLSAAGEDAVEPAVAVSPSGAASVVWQRSDGSTFLIQGRYLGFGGSPDGLVYTASEPGEDAREPEIAVAADGLGMLAWSRSDGADEVVEVQRLESSGRLSGLSSRLSAPGEAAGDPVIAVGPGGSALVAWRRFDGSFDRVQAAGFAEPGPDVLPPVHLPGGEGPAPAAGSGGPARRRPPSNRFTIGKVRLDPKDGTALLPLRLPDPGAVRLSGHGVALLSPGAKHHALIVRRAGTLSLRIGAAGSKLRELEISGRTEVRLAITFAPSGGRPRTEVHRLRLKRRPDRTHPSSL